MKQTKLKEWVKKKMKEKNYSLLTLFQEREKLLSGACGSICGGIISESDFKKHFKNKTLEQVMMALVLPDKYYKKYWELKDKGKDREAEKIFEKYAWSII